MADINKLKKQLQKATQARSEAYAVVTEALAAYAEAVAAHAIVIDRLEQEETLETARELRGKK